MGGSGRAGVAVAALGNRPAFLPFRAVLLCRLLFAWLAQQWL